MSSALRIPVFDTEYESPLERRHRPHEQRESREHEHRENDDPIDRLPGQMANIAGAAVIGSMGIGLMGMMLRK